MGRMEKRVNITKIENIKCEMNKITKIYIFIRAAAYKLEEFNHTVFLFFFPLWPKVVLLLRVSQHKDVLQGKRSGIKQR